MAINGPSHTIECDVLVVGAGISGITAIHRFRKKGLSVKCFEAGEGFGGVWYWNRYPGARVDSEWPYYQLNIPELAYSSWAFSERFPSQKELREYLDFVARTLNLRKDTYFNAKVSKGNWDKVSGRWKIETQQGHVAYAKYLMLASGLLHCPVTPEFAGMAEFEGNIVHAGAFPEAYSAAGKRIALIGAGATAVQITQEVGKVAAELHILLRCPSHCIPMGQRRLTDVEQERIKFQLDTVLQQCRKTRMGLPSHDLKPRNGDEMTPQQLEERFETCWQQGGFSFLFSIDDSVTSQTSNKAMYDFWRKKVCKRLTNREKQNIMAPEVAHYFIGTKRPPLEQDYYEIINQDNVKLVDLNATPLKRFVNNGISVGNDQIIEVDEVILATGFDAFSGSLSQMGLKNKNGEPLMDIWQSGIQTYLGLSIPDFPNLFISSSAQAPTTFSNIPTVIEVQVEMIADMIERLERQRAKSITPTRAAASEWKGSVDAAAGQTLFPFTSSWWNRSNIPGRNAENLNHVAGIKVYEEQCRAALMDWKGFQIVKNDHGV